MNRFSSLNENTEIDDFSYKKNNEIFNPVSISPILELLESQSDNFSIINQLLTSHNLTTGSLFLPQSLKLIHELLDTREELLISTFNYLDVVNMFSLIVYGDSDVFLNKIIYSIISNRYIQNEKLVLNKESIDDFIFSNEKEALNFLHSNKNIVAIYLYSLVNFISYKK